MRLFQATNRLRRQLLAGLTASALCATLLAAEPSPPAQPPSDPLQLLAGVTDAARQQPYRGTIVLVQGGAPLSIAIEHRLVGEGSELRYVALDGAPFGMQLEYPDRDCQVFADPVASLAQLPQRPLLAQLPLQEYYQVEFLGVQRVADRPSYALVALPKDALRFARRLFVDAKTGILLRSEYLSGRGQLLASSQFIAFHDSAEEFAIVAPAATQTAVVECRGALEQSQRIAAAQYSNWRLNWWPQGFTLTDYRREQSGLESYMFSDGLAQFTFFVDPANPLAVASIGGARGATSAVIRQLQDPRGQRYTVSVVGELPRAAAEQILSSVKFNPVRAATP